MTQTFWKCLSTQDPLTRSLLRDFQSNRCFSLSLKRNSLLSVIHPSLLSSSLSQSFIATPPVCLSLGGHYFSLAGDSPSEKKKKLWSHCAPGRRPEHLLKRKNILGAVASLPRLGRCCFLHSQDELLNVQHHEESLNLSFVVIFNVLIQLTKICIWKTK